MTSPSAPGSVLSRLRPRPTGQQRSPPPPPPPSGRSSPGGHLSTADKNNGGGTRRAQPRSPRSLPGYGRRGKLLLPLDAVADSDAQGAADAPPPSPSHKRHRSLTSHFCLDSQGLSSGLMAPSTSSSTSSLSLALSKKTELATRASPMKTRGGVAVPGVSRSDGALPWEEEDWGLQTDISWSSTSPQRSSPSSLSPSPSPPLKFDDDVFFDKSGGIDIPAAATGQHARTSQRFCFSSPTLSFLPRNVSSAPLIDSIDDASKSSGSSSSSSSSRARGFGSHGPRLSNSGSGAGPAGQCTSPSSSSSGSSSSSSSSSSHGGSGLPRPDLQRSPRKLFRRRAVSTNSPVVPPTPSRTDRRRPRLPLSSAIGTGSTSQVFLIVENGRDVALKRNQKGETTAAVARQSATRLPLHRNLVTVYSWDSDNESKLEYCHIELPSLVQSINSRSSDGYLPMPAMWYFIREVAAGLAAIHAAGLVHCDVKPENIFGNWEAVGDSACSFCSPRRVTRHGATRDPCGDFRPAWRPCLKIGDYGMLRPSGVELDSDYEGDYRYIAPENMLEHCSKICEPSSDVYSLGLTIFELLFDVALQDRGTLHRQIRSSATAFLELDLEDARPLSSIHQSLLKLLPRMLDLKPANRPSADDIRRQADSALAMVSCSTLFAIFTPVHAAFPSEQPRHRLAASPLTDAPDSPLPASLGRQTPLSHRTHIRPIGFSLFDDALPDADERRHASRGTAARGGRLEFSPVQQRTRRTAHSPGSPTFDSPCDDDISIIDFERAPPSTPVRPRPTKRSLLLEPPHDQSCCDDESPKKLPQPSRKLFPVGL